MDTDMVMAMATGMPPDAPLRRDADCRGCRLRFGSWLLLATSLSTPALAQTPGAEAGGRRAWSVVPRVTASQTFTDNVDLSSTAKQADQITEVSPGIRIQADTARLKGFVDYSLRNFLSAQDERRNRTQNALTANGAFEAIDKWLYLDASGTIGQQTVSAFGPQSTGAANLNPNSTQTSTFRFSPYIRGRLAGSADYTLRYSISETRVSSSIATGVTNEEFSARVSAALAGPLSWRVDASRQATQYGAGTRNQADVLSGRLTYLYSPEISGFVTAGTDSNNYRTATAQSYTTSGFGMDWTPTERTRVSVSRERRFFGNSHAVSINHRLPLAAIRFSDTRNVTVLPNQSGATSNGTYYDLLFAQLGATIPDPVARGQEVARLLQQSGIASNAAITSGYLASRVSVQRRQDLSLVLNGLRNTVTYTLFQTASESAGAAAVTSVADDLSRSTLVRTSGISSNFSHRLSPLTSLNALSSWSRTTGSSDSLKTTQRLFNINVSTRFSQRLGGSLGLRMTISDGTGAAYRENAVLGTITAHF